MTATLTQVVKQFQQDWTSQLEHDTEPEKSEKRELIEKQRRNHGIAPLHGGVMGGFYRVLGLKQLSAARRYTARP